MNAENVSKAAGIIHRCLPVSIQAAKDTAHDLNDADLISPELPDPDLAHDDPEWSQDYLGDYPDESIAPHRWYLPEPLHISVYPGEGVVQWHIDGEPEAPLSPDEARQVGLQWLAAAARAEQQAKA